MINKYFLSKMNIPAYLKKFLYNSHRYTEIEGIPPIIFKGIGEDLLDYRIDGASGGVGDLITDTSDANYNKYKVPVTIRKNIFNENSELNTNGTLNLDSGLYPFSLGDNRRTFFFNVEPNTTYTFLCSTEGDRFAVCEYNRIVNPANYSVSNRLSADRVVCSQPNGLLRYSFTTSNNAKMVAIYYSLNTLPQDIQIFEENATTTNIYLNNAISEGESVSLSDTNVNIPTVRGTNILTVDTTVQPSKVYIKVGGV